MMGKRNLENCQSTKYKMRTKLTPLKLHIIEDLGFSCTLTTSMQ